MIGNCLQGNPFFSFHKVINLDKCQTLLNFKGGLDVYFSFQ